MNRNDSNQGGLPNVSSMVDAASNDILSLLGGQPSASRARTANAYWGVGAGQPDAAGVGSFIGNRGADLYQNQADQYRQTGLQDLFGLFGSYYGNVAPSAGQVMQNNQFNSQLRQSQNQFDRNQALQEFNAQLNAIATLGNLAGKRTNPFPY